MKMLNGALTCIGHMVWNGGQRRQNTSTTYQDCMPLVGIYSLTREVTLNKSTRPSMNNNIYRACYEYTNTYIQGFCLLQILNLDKISVKKHLWHTVSCTFKSEIISEWFQSPFSHTTSH